ncbi:unnamed protein product [Lactuca virosa]|uniref:DDE Tnp4 domain-containing protein n=1 Tax=Lactuca virosa TaxID=75947 RepID=A0AAU9N6D6_9ASTR|nr:unnamed protein product [Lactuca virosa]CAH1434332.1 unnamed protein product [Lactuca virosa]
MTPIRRNKDKQKMESDDKTEIRPAGQRVVLSRRISMLVSPYKTLDNFQSLFKVSRTTFSYICSIVKEFMMSRDTNSMFLDGKSMSLNDQVAIALTRLSSVDPTSNITSFFGTNYLTVLDITSRFVDALKVAGVHHITWPPDMALVKSSFERSGGLPNCCGAIKTTHLKMYPPASERRAKPCLDRENNHSMLLQVIVDPTMRFIDLVVGWPGNMTNDRVLKKSTFFKLTQKGERLNGNKIELSDGTKVGEYIVGGSSFQLLPWLITPYQNEDLTGDQIEFNKKHLETRLFANRALKKLKDVWAGVDGGMWQPDMDKLPVIVLGCCILHNILIEMEGDGVSDVSMMSGDHDPGYSPEKSAVVHGGGAVIRDKLCLHLAGKLVA